MTRIYFIKLRFEGRPSPSNPQEPSVSRQTKPGLCSRVWSRGRFCCWGVKPSWSSPGCSHRCLAFLLESMSNFKPEMVDCGMFDWISVLWYLHVFHLFSITVGWLGFEGPKVYQAFRIRYSYRWTKPKNVLHWWVVNLSYTPSMTSLVFGDTLCDVLIHLGDLSILWVSAGHTHFSVMKNSLHGRTWEMGIQIMIQWLSLRFKTADFLRKRWRFHIRWY